MSKALLSVLLALSLHFYAGRQGYELASSITIALFCQLGFYFDWLRK